MNSLFSSGILIRFVLGEYSYENHERYNDVMDAIRLYFIVNIPKKIIRENPDIALVETNEEGVVDYYNNFINYNEKSIKVDKDQVPNNNVIYDFVTFLKYESMEINFAFSYNNIFISIVSPYRSPEQTKLMEYFNTTFSKNFSELVRATFYRHFVKMDVEFEKVEYLTKRMVYYTLPVDQYKTKLRQVFTRTFDYNDPEEVKKAIMNRVDVTKLFALQGEKIN